MKTLKPLPTAEVVRHLFSYDKTTGEFKWRNPTCSSVKPGALAGKMQLGYRVVKIKSELFNVHRLIWVYVTGTAPRELIDHINGNRADNRWVNLREASMSENTANGRVRSTNKLGIKGVARIRTKKPQWGARICRHGKIYELGQFSSPQLAQAAYIEAAKKMFGEFANAG